MPGVFISYRREDQPGYAGRLADTLEAAFGADNVFRDIEDIRPGDDFVVALHKQLKDIDVMLVMIGPAWLTASRNGVRRLDEPEDFVRMEIESGLKSGKPVLPVLVDGASMPTGDDLPATIRALARRQAFPLSDAGWPSDVARLVNFIRPSMPALRRFSWQTTLFWSLAGITLLTLLALLVVGLKSYWPGSPAIPTVETAFNPAGHWAARITYDWGAEHDEAFDLKLDNGEVHGTASYLRVARTVEQGQLQTDRLSFITHSQEVLGDASRELTHRYRGQLKADELHFVLESSGGQSPHAPVEFIARRTSK